MTSGKQKENRTAAKAANAFFWIFLTAAAMFAVYPSLCDSAAGIRQVRELKGFEEVIHSMTDEEAEKAIRRAEEYNQRIWKEQQWKSFSYRGENATDSEYESVLSEGEDGIMGYLGIPSIGLHLPVAHGTRSEVLEYELGHMYGTSLPVGGSSSHAVIAGHTGLTTAELFTHLEDMKTGDLFYMHLPGTVHAYRVCSIKTVLPACESAYLQTEENRDLITLYTCTPYGINDHRLLVTGERVLTEEGGGAGSGDHISIEKISRSSIVRTMLFAMIPAAISITGTCSVTGFMHGKRRRKHMPGAG